RHGGQSLLHAPLAQPARVLHLRHCPLWLRHFLCDDGCHCHLRRKPGGFALYPNSTSAFARLGFLQLELLQNRGKSMSSTTWKLKVLMLWHIIGALLFASLFWPVTKAYWETLDIAFFKMINSTLRDRPFWQLFWALANHKLADWVEDL